jgi:hypothetical protein
MKKNVFLIIFLFSFFSFFSYLSYVNLSLANAQDVKAKDVAGHVDEQPIKKKEKQETKTKTNEQTQSKKTPPIVNLGNRDENLTIVVDKVVLPLLGYVKLEKNGKPAPKKTTTQSKKTVYKKPVPKKTVPQKTVSKQPDQIKKDDSIKQDSQIKKDDLLVSKGKFPIIINPGAKNQNPAIIWNKLLSKNELFEWGRGMGLFLYPDSEPIINNIAGSIPKYGVQIPLEGFEINKYYRVYIDFVKWRNPSADSFPYVLKILGDSGNGYRSLAEISVKDIPKNNTFFIDLPIDMTVTGKLNLMLRELSAPENGYWAVWDIIVTERNNLPQIVPEDKRYGDDLPIRNYILD